MADLPAQRSDPVPDQTMDPLIAAQEIVDDPSKRGSAEWLAAMQLLVDQGKSIDRPGFAELEREMQALRGMSEI